MDYEHYGKPSFHDASRPRTQRRAETEAKRKDRSAAYLAKQAIQAMKDETEARARMFREAVAKADKGVFISEEKMTAWFESLGTDNELPEPEPDVFLNRA